MGSLVFPEFRQADFIGAMQAAQQYRMNEARLQQAQEEIRLAEQARQRAAQVQQMQGAALQGDPGALYQLQGFAPKEAMTLQQFGTEQQAARYKAEGERANTQAAQLKNSEMQRQEMLRRYDQQLNLLDKAQANPQAIPFVMRSLVEQGLAPAEDLQEFAQLDPADLPAVIDGLRMQRQMFADNDAAKRFEEFQMVMREKEKTMGRPLTRAESVDALNDYQQKFFAPGQGMQINIGEKQPATSAVKTNLQQDIRGGMKSLAALSVLKSNYRDNYLTWVGQARQEVGRIGAKAGLSFDKQFRAQSGTWLREMRQFFNDYKKEITGASAAVQEMEALEVSIVGEKSDPDLVPYFIEQLESKLARNLAIDSELLSQGFVAGSEAYWKEFDTRVMGAMRGGPASQPNPAGSLPSFEAFEAAYNAEMARPGTTPEQAAQRAKEALAK